MEQCIIVKRQKFNQGSAWGYLIDDLLISIIHYLQLYYNYAFINPMRVNRHWAGVLRTAKFWMATSVCWPCVQKSGTTEIPAYLFHSRSWTLLCNDANHLQCAMDSDERSLACVQVLKEFRCNVSILTHSQWKRLQDHSTTLTLLNLDFSKQQFQTLSVNINLPNLVQFICIGLLNTTAQCLICRLLLGMPKLHTFELDLPVYEELPIEQTSFYHVLSTCANLSWLCCTIPFRMSLSTELIFKLSTCVKLTRFDLKGDFGSSETMDQIIINWLPGLKSLRLDILFEDILTMLTTSTVAQQQSFINLQTLKVVVNVSNLFPSCDALPRECYFPNLQCLTIRLQNGDSTLFIRFFLNISFCVNMSLSHLSLVFDGQHCHRLHTILASLLILPFEQLQSLAVKVIDETYEQSIGVNKQQSNTALLLRVITVFVQRQSARFQQFRLDLPRTHYHPEHLISAAHEINLPLICV